VNPARCAATVGGAIGRFVRWRIKRVGVSRHARLRHRVVVSGFGYFLDKILLFCCAFLKKGQIKTAKNS
jgi:hypothetical protein